MKLPQPLRALLSEAVCIQRGNRVWRLPAAAAFASGVPLLLAAAAGNLSLGLPGSLAALVFLHLPASGFARRMRVVGIASLGMIASYVLGVVSHDYAGLALPVVAGGSFVAVLVCRLQRLPPPGPLFFVMALSMAAYTPMPATSRWVNIGLFAAGCLLALAVAMVFSCCFPAADDQRSDRGGGEAPGYDDFDFVVTDSAVIAAALGVALACAHALGVARPYWAAVSCLAVVQAVSLHAAWLRNFQRVAGTAIGLLLFGALAAKWTGPWGIAAAVTALTFLVEYLVARHYGTAVVFITCLALLLAEAAQLPSPDVSTLLHARFLDTAVGAAWGLAGAALLNNAPLRSALGRGLRVVLRAR